MKPQRAMAAALAMSLAATAIAGSGDDRTRSEIALSQYGYVVHVPKEWAAKDVEEGVSMKLHLEVQPVKKVVGHFTGHVMTRNGAGLEKWLEHHLEKNLSSVHGNCQVESVDNITAGAYDAKLIRVSGMENRKGYGLLDALIVTDAHAVVLSYLYDLECAPEARKHMLDIASSFRYSPETAEQARLNFEVGCTLGLEDFGLFLRLPEGWIPENKKGKRNEVSISSPGGGLTVMTFKRGVSGIEELKELVRKRIPELTGLSNMAPASMGEASREAFLSGVETSGVDSLMQVVLGLHCEGGYALVVSSRLPEDLRMLRKIAAKALLLEPDKARGLRRREIHNLQKGLRTKDAESVGETLSNLTLFSENIGVTREIGKGLKVSHEEIQIGCAVALGRMGSGNAVALLENAIKSNSTQDGAKIACIESLGLIGGKKAREILIKTEKRLPRTCTADLRNTLSEALSRCIE